MGKLKYRVGMVFGKLTVLSQFVENKRTFIIARCECGEEKKIRADHVDYGKIISCGCYGRTVAITHDKSCSVEYTVFAGIQQRCYNKNSSAYADYGLRGILCEWESFESFIQDMGNRPSSKHTIERIDVNKNYNINNCIWTDDRGLQNYNQNIKITNTSGKTGVCWQKNSEKWSAEIGVGGKAIKLGLFESFDEAVSVRQKAELKYYGFGKE